ncbi:hypothetical protein MPLA_680089 [Mesorhizobium sp. ORS 3359]|nr:hypothetical protein MPLA_680089 [Mesorhizobium sp. ORS 3359]
MSGFSLEVVTKQRDRVVHRFRETVNHSKARRNLSDSLYAL